MFQNLNKNLNYHNKEKNYKETSASEKEEGKFNPQKPHIGRQQLIFYKYELLIYVRNSHSTSFPTDELQLPPPPSWSVPFDKHIQPPYEEKLQ